MAKESSTFDLLLDDIGLLMVFHESENDDGDLTIDLKLLDEVEDDHFIPMLDAQVANELQLQECLLASLETPSTSEDAKEIGESSDSFCEICVENKGSNEMFSIETCNHFFCTDCISKHIAAKVQNGSHSVTCPGMNCKVALEFDSCKSIVESHVLDRWNEVLCVAMIHASQRFYCPYKDCSGFLFKDSDEVVKESECPMCHRLFCAACCIPWHSGIECDEYRKLDADERGKEDLMVIRLAKENEWSRCPSCKVYVEKTEGCRHMTCRCGFEFCYACGATWTENHGGCRP